jgi:dTDP-4-amino-4,6-dideoxygalactose transaminase
MTDTMIPFLDLTTPHRQLEEELIAAARAAIHDARFIGGPELEGFEGEFAAYCGTRYCVGVASGTDAVRFALMAAGIGRGSAVLTVANTFIATVEGISQAGADTEFVDVDPRTYNMCPDALERYLASCETDRRTGRPLGRRTGTPLRALVPVHLYGQVADMDAISAIARQYDLIVVEDACQAHGAEYHGLDGPKRAGAFGNAAAFSFYPGKNLGACGEAGAVTTDDEQLASKVRMLRDHGQARKYFHALEGYNGRLDALQAAFLRVKLRRLDEWTLGRREAARRYAELLRPIAAAADLVIPHEPEWSRAVYHLYVIQVPDRDWFVSSLSEAGIQTGLHYPLPLHRQDCYSEWGYAEGALPVTERAAARIVSLPMFPTLSAAQQERVADTIRVIAESQVPR